MKNTDKNNPTSDSFPDLLTVAPGTKPIAGEYATVAQIITKLPFLAASGVDETFLRNRAREINPRTSAPWIPKPRNNHFAINATLLGLLEWFAAKAAERDGLPAYFDSMQAMENSPLRTPKEFTKWSLKNGAAAAQIGGSRIDPRPVLAKAADILRLIPTGRVAGIEGFEEVNTSQELGLKIREERVKLQDEALLRKGQMLLASDGSFALTKMAVDELLWEKLLQPARAATLKLPPAINRQHKTILKDAGVAEETIRRCATVVLDTVAGLLDKLRAKIPAQVAATVPEKKSDQ